MSSEETETSIASTEPPHPNTPKPDPIEWFRENSIPIGGVLFIGLGVCLLLHCGATTTDLTKTKDLADVLNNYVQAIAIVAAGFWAVFTFSKGRQFQESLILNVSGRIFVMDSRTYIVANTRIQNIGQSKIRFSPGSSTLCVNEYLKAPMTDVVTVPDTIVGQFNPLHEKDLYIEPNEIIYGTRLISIPHPPDLGFRLDFEVISARNSYTWRTSCVVEKSTPRANIEQAGFFPTEDA